MELSNKQYNVIERYVDGAMEPNEKEAFEATLLQDNELAEEIEAFKEIFALADSIKQKIYEAAALSSEKRITDTEVRETLEKERRYWEAHHEEELKRIYGLAGPMETNIAGEERQGKVIGINGKRWLAAAVVTGLVGLGGILWWYVQPVSNKAAIANHSKKADTGNIVNNNRNENGQGDLARKRADTPRVANNTVTNSVAKKQEPHTKDLNKAEQQQELYARNFVPDAPPEQRTELLENAFEHYEKGNYKQASIAYEQAQKEVESLTTRTPDDGQDEAASKRIMFYAHYYNALSYLAAGNTSKAIRALKAIKESPDAYWQSKQQWYLALAYLKAGDTAKAMALLQQVASSNEAGEYRQKAIQLSKALKE